MSAKCKQYVARSGQRARYSMVKRTKTFCRLMAHSNDPNRCVADVRIRLVDLPILFRELTRGERK
jgi:hypothetical protein